MSCALPLPAAHDASAHTDVVIASPAMRAAHELVRRVASRDVPVLLLGETGVGKEVLARAIHDLGRWRNGPLKVLNCGAIPAGLLESLLFGHERGAFTDARGTSRGVFEQADGGTLFLDEVGELPRTAQAALLRVLETRRVTRIGGSAEIAVDTRIVAATNRDLGQAVARGDFRLDLLHRIDAVTIRIPPLRERREEIDPLIDALLPALAQQLRLPVPQLSDEARARLHAHGWPGNIRELRNALELAIVMTSDTGRIEPGDLPAGLRRTAGPAEAETETEVETSELSFRQRVQAYEWGLIRDALRQTLGNQQRAAALLRIPVRTLAFKLRQYRRRGGAVPGRAPAELEC